jgi:hypothetical protein
MRAPRTFEGGGNLQVMRIVVLAGTNVFFNAEPLQRIPMIVILQNLCNVLPSLLQCCQRELDTNLNRKLDIVHRTNTNLNRKLYIVHRMNTNPNRKLPVDSMHRMKEISVNCPRPNDSEQQWQSDNHLSYAACR